MKVTKKTEVVYTLKLNQEERDWLRGLMQNPLNGTNPSNEDEFDRGMRAIFWEALE